MQHLDLGLFTDLNEYETLGAHLASENALSAEAISFTTTVGDINFGQFIAAETFQHTTVIADAQLAKSVELIADQFTYSIEFGPSGLDLAQSGLGQILSYGLTHYNPSPTATFLSPEHTLATSDVFVAEAFSFSWTVADASLSSIHSDLVADQFSYAWTGGASGLTAQKQLTAESASYVYTPGDANFVNGYVLNVDAIAHVTAIADAAFSSELILAADSAAYATTVNDASLEYSGGTYLLNAETAAYTTAANADLLRGTLLTAETVGYSITVGDATFLASRRIGLNQAAYYKFR